MRLLFFPLYSALFVLPLAAEEKWAQELARMPMPSSLHEVAWSNCVPELLGAFRSNQAVKAILFMPGAADELYTFHRVRCSLPTPATLSDAIAALQHGGLLQVTFRAPFLLVHTDADLLEPDIAIRNEAAKVKLAKRATGRLLFYDRDWDAVQPVLKWQLKTDLRPWRGSSESWHFYRHSLAAFGLSGWEAVEAFALAGKTKVTVSERKLLFEPDRRARKAPRFETGLPIGK